MLHGVRRFNGTYMYISVYKITINHPSIQRKRTHRYGVGHTRCAVICILRMCSPINETERTNDEFTWAVQSRCLHRCGSHCRCGCRNSTYGAHTHCFSYLLTMMCSVDLHDMCVFCIGDVVAVDWMCIVFYTSLYCSFWLCCARNVVVIESNAVRNLRDRRMRQCNCKRIYDCSIR